MCLKSERVPVKREEFSAEQLAQQSSARPRSKQNEAARCRCLCCVDLLLVIVIIITWRRFRQRRTVVVKFISTGAEEYRGSQRVITHAVALSMWMHSCIAQSYNLWMVMIDGVERTKMWAFLGCKSLSSVRFPGVKFVGAEGLL
jgi:hypothetical protein